MHQLLAAVARRSFLDAPRLENLYERAMEVSGLEGDFVECGCGGGGSAALLAGVIHRTEANRRLILCDTFCGLPPPDPDADQAEGWDRAKLLSATGSARGTKKQVADLCQLTGPGVTVNLVAGLYADTLPILGPGPIALLHADADWYYSTKEILRHLYHHVVPGGIVIFDDYHFWSGCRLAVDEYLAKLEPRPKMEHVSCAAWFRKPE